MEHEFVRELNPADKFFRSFQRDLADISEKIEKLGEHGAAGSDTRSNAVEQCQASITELSNEVRDASSYIPAHDRRIYGEGIKGLQQKLKDAQAAFAPKPKFSFKSGKSSFVARKNESAVGGDDTAGSTNGVMSAIVSPKPNAPSSRAGEGNEAARKGPNIKDLDQARPLSLEQNDSMLLSNRNNEHILLSSTESSGNLSTLRNCIVDLRKPAATGTPFVSLTLKNISESLIICGQVDGPVHLTNISNSVIVVSSRQFRMHESQKCDLYVHITSRPIIENSSSIRFAPLPDLYKTEFHEQKENQWQQVDDFNWHRSEPSPNWSVLDISHRVTSDTWRGVASSGQSRSVEDILKTVNLPR